MAQAVLGGLKVVIDFIKRAFQICPGVALLLWQTSIE